ncbi:MAG: N-acetylmuramoyl-L-alanine amidase [Xanthomonadaceae bacterium]|nr:N-acetylmuramoyl-L-alanine amidase [Xanthomonadaceae bacterium]
MAALCWNLAQANEINTLQVSADATGTRAELQLPAEPTYKAFALRGPDRWVIDVSGIDAGKPLRLPAPAGLIKAVRTGRPAADTLRIVFDLASPMAAPKPRIETAASGVRLVFEWPGQPAASAPQASTIQTSASQANPPQAGAIASAAAGHSATASPSPNLASTATAPKPTTVATKPIEAVPGSGPIVAVAPTGGSVAQTAAQTSAQTSPPPSTTIPKPPPSATVPASTQPAATLPTPSVAQGTTKPATATAAIASPTTAPPPTSATLPPMPMPRGLSGRPLIVAIDAGHGGQDPGAIGPTGKREKDVTLAIARELARQINATPGLKAVLTRDTDMFLPLPRRTQLARQAKADMFVSIHADAAENRAAKGSSVYVLSLRGASSKRARWLADKENAADLIGGHPVPEANNTLTSVLLDLTQSGQMRASESAAAHVLDGLKGVGYNHKPHIERANFSVLRTSDMPAMLVETAFISNPDEEKRLTDPAYQRNLARAVLAGVDTYFQRQPPPGTLYAARAKAAEATKQTDAPVVVAKAATATTGGSPE